jgi:hypothetical protein
LRSDDNATTSTPGRSSNATGTTPDPKQLKALWQRQQGARCQRLNEEAAAPRPVGESAADPKNIANLRGAARELRALSRDSAALAVPEDFRDRMQQAVGYWSAAAVHAEGMIRAAQQDDRKRYLEQKELLNTKVSNGMRIAYDLGATQCV